jgi:hypothetical protein
MNEACGTGSRDGPDRLCAVRQVPPCVWQRVVSKVLCLTHIAKTGGTAALHQLVAWNYTLPGDGESCFEAVRAGTGARYPHAVMLREPFDHVLSQWLYCSRSRWGKAVVAESLRAQTFQVWRKSPGLAGLQGWLDWFVDQPAQPEHFNCYSPDNMQTRALSCASPRGFGSHGYSAPNISLALANVASIEHIGVLELYEPSMCVWFFRTHGTLPSSCRHACDSPPAAVQHRSHLAMVEGAPHLRQRLQRLTRLDHIVYAAAEMRLLRDIAAVERGAGVILLCHDQRLRYHKARALQHGRVR